MLSTILVAFAILMASTVNAFTAPKPAFQRSHSPVLAREWPRMASTDAGPVTTSPVLAREWPHMVTMDAGPATLEPETIEEVKEDVKEDKKEQSAGTKMPAWEVRLFNDPFNKREFVARCLATVCGKNDTESYQIMMQAHQNGMGIIGRYDFEIAELYNKSLKDNGLLVDMVPVDDE